MVDKIKEDVRYSIKNGKVQELLEELDERIEEVQSSGEFKDILKFYSRFHNYSYHNTMLIQMQHPGAAHVAGYQQWKDKFNRHVRQGEKGIAILAPITYTTTETEIEEVEIDGELVKREVEKDVEKTYFKPVYLYDVSQTEGEELPQIDTSLEDTKSELLEPLIEYAENKGITVQYKPLPDKSEGYTKNDDEIIINQKRNDTEKAAILIHEIAHIKLHQGEEVDEDIKYNEEIKEMEAEAVAFVVTHHFDLEIKSDNYLALYQESYDLQDSFKRIKNISNQLLQNIVH